MSSNATSLVPGEYKGREQTWIKHSVLREYLISWANKIASFSRRGKVKLWYVDTFAGPWKSQDAEYQDTSIAIGLNALQDAATFWKSHNLTVEIGAIFIEANPTSFSELQTFLASLNLDFQTYPLKGTFEANIETVERLIADDPAFCFVDPTGWKGADMHLIKRLIAKPRRDVMINFMYDYVNRFKDHREGSQHQEMTSFFGAEIPQGLPEEDLMKFYREQLVKNGGIKYSADLIVQDPCRDRTKFRIVVGGSHIEVLKLFREVEKKIVLRKQPLIRLVAKENRELEKTGQLSLLSPAETLSENDSDSLLEQHEEHVLNYLPLIIEKLGSVSFETLYPHVLQDCHITYGDLKKLIWKLKENKMIEIKHSTSNSRAIKEADVILAVKEHLSLQQEADIQLNFIF